MLLAVKYLYNRPSIIFIFCYFIKEMFFIYLDKKAPTENPNGFG